MQNIAKAISIWIIFEVLLVVFMPLNFWVPELIRALILGSGLSIVMYVCTRVYLRNDQLTLFDIGMTFGRYSLRRFFMSFAIGCIVFGSFFTVYLLFTPVLVVPNSDAILWQVIGLSLCSFVVLGIMEEVVFRGYLMHKLKTVAGIRVSIYVTSILFGLYHGLELESLTGPAVWGLYYAVLAFWSRGLAVPIGFHVGVNYIQAIFSEKQKWTQGLWHFDVSSQSALLSVEQVSLALYILLFITGVGLVEYYVRNIHKD